MQTNEETEKATYEVVVTGDEVREGGGGRTYVIDEGIGYLMNYAAKSVARRQAARLTARGAHLGQWAVLLFLWARDGQTQTELSRHVVIENATMVRTLDRMERDGLVRRVRSTQDRRRTNIYLTEKGWGLRDVLVPCALETNEEATRDFTEEEKEQLAGFLRRMISSLASQPEVQNETKSTNDTKER